MAHDLVRLHDELQAAIRGLTDVALSKAPAGKWSPGQILEHLFLSYRGTNFGIGKCLEIGKPLATSSTLPQRLKTLVVVGFGYMPSGTDAPKVAVPKGLPTTEVRLSIFAEIEKMDSGLADCERRFGPRVKLMDHPILGPLSVSQWRKLHLVHARHHIKQIRERAKLG